MTNAPTAKQRAMLQAIAQNEDALRRYAQSRAEIINPRVYEKSYARQIFEPIPLETGETLRYDITAEDVQCVWAMPKIGEVPTAQIEVGELHVPVQGLNGGIEVRMDDLRDGRLDVSQIATRSLENSFIRQEELMAWSLIHSHAAQLPASQRLQARAADGTEGTAGSGVFNYDTLIDLMTTAQSLGVGGRRVRHVFISPTRQADLMRISKEGNLPERIQEQFLGLGQVGNVGNTDPNSDHLKTSPMTGGIQFHTVYNPRLVPDDKAYIICTNDDHQRYGVLPQRSDIETYHDPRSLVKWMAGIIGRERLGMAIVDDKGLIELTF